MAYVAIVAAVAGAAIAGYGAVKQGQAAKETSDYNAKIAERDALAAKNKADYDAEQSELKFNMLLGKQKALYAKSGVNLSEGSPLLMMTFQAEQAAKDKQAILFEGKSAEQADLDRANLFRMSGDNSATAGYISGGSTFLSGVSNAYTASKK